MNGKKEPLQRSKRPCFSQIKVKHRHCNRHPHSSQRATRIPRSPDKAFVTYRLQTDRRRAPRLGPPTIGRKSLLRQFSSSDNICERSQYWTLETLRERLYDIAAEAALENTGCATSAFLHPSDSARHAFPDKTSLRYLSCGREANRSSSNHAKITARAPEPCAREVTATFATNPSHRHLRRSAKFNRLAAHERRQAESDARMAAFGQAHRDS